MFRDFIETPQNQLFSYRELNRRMSSVYKITIALFKGFAFVTVNYLLLIYHSIIRRCCTEISQMDIRYSGLREIIYSVKSCNILCDNCKRMDALHKTEGRRRHNAGDTL